MLNDSMASTAFRLFNSKEQEAHVRKKKKTLNKMLSHVTFISENHFPYALCSESVFYPFIYMFIMYEVVLVVSCSWVVLLSPSVYGYGKLTV